MIGPGDLVMIVYRSTVNWRTPYRKCTHDPGEIGTVLSAGYNRLPVPNGTHLGNGWIAIGDSLPWSTVYDVRWNDHTCTFASKLLRKIRPPPVDETIDEEIEA